MSAGDLDFYYTLSLWKNIDFAKGDLCVFCFVLFIEWRVYLVVCSLKDGSLCINTLASDNCFGYRNIFQNGVSAL